MGVLGNDFCSVCVEGIIEEIHDRLLFPVDSFWPGPFAYGTSFPDTFGAQFIEPIPNTLKKQWLMDNVPLVSGQDSYVVHLSDLSPGLNVLMFQVIDTTDLIGNPNHQTGLHSSTILWYLDPATGVTNSQEESFHFTLSPNPTSDIVNIVYDGSIDQTIQGELADLNGKILKRFKLRMGDTTELSMANLSAGVYVISFYKGNIKLMNRRIVRQ